jgi:hypothetical protein
MIGCLILAFALCQVPAPGYYVQPVAPGYQPGYPVPIQPAYYPPPPVYYAAPAYYPPVAVGINLGLGGWGGGHWWGGHGGHWHR